MRTLRTILITTLLIPIVALIALAPGAARAEEPEPLSVPTWSFGAGVDFGSGLGNVLPQGDVERRIGQRTALLLAVSADYDRRMFDESGVELGGAHGQLGMGVRWLWTRMGPMRVSLMATARLTYNWSEFVSSARQDADGWEVEKGFQRLVWPSVGGGLAFDLPLIDGLTLRMTSGLVRFGARIYDDSAEDHGGVLDDRTEWWGGLSLEPALQLRVEL